jgi:hypothetical protein
MLTERKAHHAKVSKREKRLPRREVIHTARVMLTNVYLQQWCPPAYNQLQLGSCTSNGICHTILTTSGECKNGQWPPLFEPSRKFNYVKERLLEAPGVLPPQDEGADAADGCELIATIGICRESLCPYDGLISIPSAEADNDAKSHLYPMFQNVTDNGDKFETIRSLVDANEPPLLAFEVFESFMSIPENCLTPPIMPIPGLGEEVVGGHEVMCCGYEHIFGQDYALCLNSWGPQWGFKGFFLMAREALAYVQQILSLRPLIQWPLSQK